MNPHFKTYKNKKFPNIGNEVHGYKVKTNYFLMAIIIGILLALIYQGYKYSKHTDAKAQTYFQHLEITQPLITSSNRVVLQGE